MDDLDRLDDDVDANEAERDFTLSTRPRRLAEYIGQRRLKENLSIFIEAARARAETLDHTLLHGPPGLGKTTLAHIISAELGASILVSSGPMLRRVGDLVGMLTNLGVGDILFIDEIHRLSAPVEEALYPAMEEKRIDVMIGQGASARSINIVLSPFTLVGATTRSGLLSAPLRARFGIVDRLEYYSVDDLLAIVTRAARLIGAHIDQAGALEIARRSRGTPRIANRLLRRARDFAQIRSDGSIDAELADEALESMGIDEVGLDRMDRKLLRSIAENFRGGPVGLETLAAALAEDKGTIEEAIEPYLIQEGFLERSARGRLLTAKAYERVGLEAPRSDGDLFSAGKID